VPVDPSESRQLIEGAAAVGLRIDGQTLDRVDRFLNLLQIWNRRLRLTGDRQRPVLLQKHVIDSLALVPELPAAAVVADLGSGAGFPGIVLGCARPDLPLVLIESRRRAASFLSEAIRTARLPAARVAEMRAEQAARDPALAGRIDLAVSRALRLDALLRLGRPLLAAGGRLIAMQTPALEEGVAAALGPRFGFRLLRIRDYALPGGERRRLLVFAPA
jgi:16S rRNA (guanine527-N7)-methyltransferase